MKLLSIFVFAGARNFKHPVQLLCRCKRRCLRSHQGSLLPGLFGSIWPSSSLFASNCLWLRNHRPMCLRCNWSQRKKILLAHALSGAPVRFGKRLEAARPSEEGAGLWLEARWGVPAVPFKVMFAWFRLLLDKRCSQEADVGFSFAARQGDDLVWNILTRRRSTLGMPAASTTFSQRVGCPQF